MTKKLCKEIQKRGKWTPAFCMMCNHNPKTCKQRKEKGDGR
jgi:hypothetical protein